MPTKIIKNKKIFWLLVIAVIIAIGFFAYSAMGSNNFESIKNSKCFFDWDCQAVNYYEISGAGTEKSEKLLWGQGCISKKDSLDYDKCSGDQCPKCKCQNLQCTSKK